MTLKSALRQLLLLPLWPRVFLVFLWLLRTLGVLPRRIAGHWPPRRILLVNITGNLGDALMMLPLVDSLHRALPGAALDLLVEAPIDAPLRAIPWVRHVFRFERDTKKVPFFGNYLRVFRMLQYARSPLMKQPYDLALLPRWGTDPSLSSYLAAMSTAPRRCGHDPAEETSAAAVFPDMAAMLTMVSHGGSGLAEGVREQLLLPACGLIANLDPASEERRPVESILAMADSIDIASCARRLGVSLEQPFVLLAPGASHPCRCWPSARFAALGTELHRHSGVAVYAIGAPADGPLGREVEALSGGIVRSLAGKTTILEAVALTHRAALLITNDSGPAHVGGSVGTPTIVLSICPITSTREHGNSPLRVRPVGPIVRVLQPDQPAPDCGDRCRADCPHCILGIPVDTVLTQALEVLHTPIQTDGSGGNFRMDRTTTAGAPTATV